MTDSFLPNVSWVPVITRRVRSPRVLWAHPSAGSSNFDPEQIFCCPKEDEDELIYTGETRTEWADRYGGIGVGHAGGSGRCSTFNGVQTKGVGPTPLVATSADRYHSSGILQLVDAASEVVFSAAYQEALPYGAVPVIALAITGSKSVREFAGAQVPCRRAVVMRPFVPRPAHFMRNLFHQAQVKAVGPDAPGLTVDTWRVIQAMACLPKVFVELMPGSVSGADDRTIIESGLYEMARRFASQGAAGFAKRLPHGTLSCSNIALDGAYLDFGLSSFLPAYRRLCWGGGQDPWTEAEYALRSLVLLARQLDTYHPSMHGTGANLVDGIIAVHRTQFRRRMIIEMVRMTGWTEELAEACPNALLEPWFDSMRAIWTRGADERFVIPDGILSNGQPAPPPRRPGRYDLSQVIAASGSQLDEESMDKALAPIIDDSTLRWRYVKSTVAARRWLAEWLEVSMYDATAYISRQSERKSRVISCLTRNQYADVGNFRQLEIEDALQELSASISESIDQAHTILCDLDPEIEGRTGREQIVVLAARSRACA